jgi:hypothetical protein
MAIHTMHILGMHIADPRDDLIGVWITMVLFLKALDSPSKMAALIRMQVSLWSQDTHERQSNCRGTACISLPLLTTTQLLD